MIKKEDTGKGGYLPAGRSVCPKLARHSGQALQAANTDSRQLIN